MLRQRKNQILSVCSSLIAKIMPKGSSGGFYAVKRGYVPGVYNTWDECQEQTKGFSGARYKKFPTKEDAHAFIHGEPKDGTDEKDTEQGGPAPPTYTRPKDTAPGYSTPRVADVAMSRAIRTGQDREYRSSCSSDNPSTTPSSSLDEVDLRSIKALSSKLCSSVNTVGEHLDEGSDILRQLRVKTTSFPGRTKDTLRLYDEMLLEAENQVKSLEDLVSQGQKYCQDLESSKRSRSESQGESTAPECSLQGDGPETSDRKKIKTQASSGLRAVEVYTDGCCHNNGRGEASAGYGVYWGPGHANNLGEKLTGRQTNNRAEIYAAQKAIEQAKSGGFDEILVYTDSKFLINCITKWIHKWKANGWKLANGGDVINKPDLEELDVAMKGIVVKWEHVRGHAGIPGNEAADKLANDGARKGFGKT